MSVTRIAYRYAKSLLDLSVEKNALEEVHGNILTFLEASKNRDFELLLLSPVIKADKKKKILNLLFGDKFHEITKSFFRIITTKGREAYLVAIARGFVDQYKRYKHITSVKLITAVPVSKEVVEAFKKKLVESQSTDDFIELETEVDEKIKGGFILQFDNKLFDASLAHKIELLKKEFKINEYIKNF